VASRLTYSNLKKFSSALSNNAMRTPNIEKLVKSKKFNVSIKKVNAKFFAALPDIPFAF